MIWAMLGPRTLAVIAVVALVLYGRSGVLRSPVARAFWPWPMPPARRPGPAPAAPGSAWRLNDRTFWFLTVIAASAVAAWIVTRTLIVSTSAGLH